MYCNCGNETCTIMFNPHAYVIPFFSNYNQQNQNQISSMDIHGVVTIKIAPLKSTSILEGIPHICNFKKICEQLHLKKENSNLQLDLFKKTIENDEVMNIWMQQVNKITQVENNISFFDLAINEYIKWMKLHNPDYTREDQYAYLKQMKRTNCYNVKDYAKGVINQVDYINIMTPGTPFIELNPKRFLMNGQPKTMRNRMNCDLNQYSFSEIVHFLESIENEVVTIAKLKSVRCNSTENTTNKKKRRKEESIACVSTNKKSYNDKSNNSEKKSKNTEDNGKNK